MWKRFTDCFPCGRRTNQRKRSGASNKAPFDASSSEESEKYLANQLGNSYEEAVGSSNVNSVAEASSPQKFEQKQQISEQNKAERSEGLRCPVFGRKSDNENDGDESKDDRGQSKDTGTSREEQLSTTECDLSRLTSSAQPGFTVKKSQEIVISEIVSETEEENKIFNERQSVHKTNNAEQSESNIKNSSKEPQTTGTVSAGDSQPGTINKLPKIVLSEAVDDILEAVEDILGKERNINTSCDIKTVSVANLSKEPSVSAERAVEDSEVMKVSVKETFHEIGASEASVEPHEERDSTVEEEPYIGYNSGTNKSDHLSSGCNKFHEHKLNYRPIEEVNDSGSELVPDRKVDQTFDGLFDSNSYEKSESFVITETFAEKLSKSVLDAALQDTQFLYKSEEEPDDDNFEKDVCKFSSILADSIVKTVLDYSKINLDHMDESDENSNSTTNDADCAHVEAEKCIKDVALSALIPNEDDACSMDETVDDASFKSLEGYAKRLSEQILRDVYKLNHHYNESVSSSSEAYISQLTETVLSQAINGAKYHVSGSRSSPDSTSSVTEDSDSLDTFINEIVQNVLYNAISQVGEHMKHVEVRNDMGNCLKEHIEVLKVSEGSPKVEETAKNGKFQSKWLSEDDLDELYDDDLSDEDNVKAEHSPDSSTDEEDITNETTNNLNTPNCPTDREDSKTENTVHLRSPDSLTKNEQTAFWRKSLIQDLDEDLEFDEDESQQSSPPSSPTKPANFEAGNECLNYVSSSDEETNDNSPSAKVPVDSSKTGHSTSTRSRLRSVDNSPVLVFDNGSAFLRIGFSGEDTPREIAPSVVGTPLRYSQDISGMEYSNRPGLIYGGLALGKGGVLHIDYPLKADVVEKWSDVEGLWNYVLGGCMGIQDHPDFPVLITQPALNSKKNTEKLAEILFEHFHMPSLFIASQPVLSLFSMGFTSGLSFCSGFNKTQAGVVYEGHILPHTVRQLDIAGYQLTENLRKLLLMSGQGFGNRSSSQWQIVNDIKEKMAFVSMDFQADAQRYKSQAELQEPYELPDGQFIEIGLERFGCAETLFRPTELGLAQPPAHMLITEAIDSCDAELQEMCYRSIGISGGTTLMRGFVPRLENELRGYDRRFKNFTVPEQRNLSTWLGGSIVASLPTFREMVVTVDEYADTGARAVHSKCF